MARSFSSADAKQLIRSHQEILTSLRQVREQWAYAQSGVKNAADSMVMAAVLEVLRGVPVEELNREKRGIKVKTLRDSGYQTLADVAPATVVQLASVNDIGEDSAYLIRGILDKMIEQTKAETKIRLSADRRTPEATALVTAISSYRRFLPLSDRAGRLLAGQTAQSFQNSFPNAQMHSAWTNQSPQIPGNPSSQMLAGQADSNVQSQGNQAGSNVQSQENQITTAITALTPATNGFKWFFTGSAKKQQAEAAFDYLSGLLGGAYGIEAGKVNRLAAEASHLTADLAWGDFQENSIRFFNVLEEICPGVLGADDVRYGLPDDLAREIGEEEVRSDGLLCTLRRYQEWGVKYILHQKRVLLGDEMGLGKTIQAIAAMVAVRNLMMTSPHFLVICPASVLTNWCREIADKSDLKVTKIHGALRNLAMEEWIRTGGVAVTTYETAGLIHEKLESLSRQQESNWENEGVSEKSAESVSTDTVSDIFRVHMLVVDEAHYIKNPAAQRTRHVKAIAERADRLLFMTGTALENRVSEMISLIEILQPEVAAQVRGMEYLAAAPQFRLKVAPVYYRRRREDVLTELPELIEEKEWCNLLPEEEALYEQAVLCRHYANARRVSWNVPDLRQSSKANRMLELIEEAEDEGRKVLVFSFFLDTLGKISALLGGRCMPVINGSVPPARRQEIIDDFNKAPAGTVLAAQIQSGGTGLNIQSASVVVICEPQLKPSVENQAISRAYRMGQTRNVLVFRLLCDDTVDEKITDLLEDKQAVFDAFADESAAGAQSIQLEAATQESTAQAAAQAGAAQAAAQAGKTQTAGMSGTGASGAAPVELDEKTLGKIIEEEAERITAKYEILQTQGNQMSVEISADSGMPAGEEIPADAGN